MALSLGVGKPLCLVVEVAVEFATSRLAAVDCRGMVWVVLLVGSATFVCRVLQGGGLTPSDIILLLSLGCRLLTVLTPGALPAGCHLDPALFVWFACAVAMSITRSALASVATPVRVGLFLDGGVVPSVSH